MLVGREFLYAIPDLRGVLEILGHYCLAKLFLKPPLLLQWLHLL